MEHGSCYHGDSFMEHGVSYSICKTYPQTYFNSQRWILNMTLRLYDEKKKILRKMISEFNACSQRMLVVSLDEYIYMIAVRSN